MATPHPTVEESMAKECALVTEMPYRIKMFKTLCMLMIYVGMGAWAGVVAPTVVDMTTLYNCTTESFVHTVTYKAIGVMAGSFIGASVADRFRAQADIFLFFADCIGGLTTVAIPWSPSLVVMAILWFINGISHGTINVVCSSLCIAIWGKSAPRPIHALHMMFTIGLTIAPPISIPFLSENLNHHYNHTNLTDLSSVGDFVQKYTTLLSGNYDNYMAAANNVNDDVYSIYSNTSHCKDLQVRIPYAIFGIWSIVVSLFFLAFYFCGWVYTSTTVRKSESVREMLNPAKLAAGNLKFGVFFIVSLFVLYIFIQGRDRGLAMFIFVIANTAPLSISKPISAVIVMIFNLCTAVGRGLGGLLSKWISIHVLLMAQLFLGCTWQILLVFFGLQSEALFWSLICLTSVFMGPTYPAVMSWTDRYIEASGLVIAVIDIGIGTGSFISLWISGTIYQRYGPNSVFIMTAVFGGCVLLFFLPLQIVGHIKGDRHNTARILDINTTETSQDDMSDSEPLIT